MISPQKLVPAVQNATTIQRLLASAGRPMGVTQIARETGLNVSSVFNILRTLNHEGLASFDPLNKTYETGLGLLELAQPLLGANPSDLLRPICRDIAQRHNVMLALWQITSTERIILIDAFSAPKLVQAVISPQSRLPVFVGAVGRCYGRHPQAEQGGNPIRLRQRALAKAARFRRLLTDVLAARQTRQAQDRGYLFRGLDIVASIVRDGGGLPRLGLSSITISEQLDDRQLNDVSEALVTAATRSSAHCSASLGRLIKPFYKKLRYNGGDMSETKPLDGKVLLVTGAGGGIGRAIAIEAAKAGASVVVNDLGATLDGQRTSSAAAQDAVTEIEKLGGRAVANGDDVSNAGGASAMVRQATDTFGRLDAVVNNAGILRDCFFHKMTHQDFDAVVKVHLYGTFNVSRAAADVMREQNSGSLIHMTSTSGLVGNLAQANYSAAKLGITAFRNPSRST